MERYGNLHGHGVYCRSWAAHPPREKLGKPVGDNAIVEELLDFSKVIEDDVGMAAGSEGVLEPARINCSTDSFTITAVDRSTKSFSRDSDSQLPEENICRSLTDPGIPEGLCEPYEELAELEWLSNFVEDSFSSEELHKQQLISGIHTVDSQPTYQSNHPFDVSYDAAADNESSPALTPKTMLPGKISSKRARTLPGNLSLNHRVIAPTTEISSSDHSSMDILQPIPVKQPTKKKELSLVPSVVGRRCLHCATDKTPQWRAGPLGPKSLCNACGVRYKSGRLVPEYRPAASPTFVTSKHSNSHRKVLEIRKQKEIHQQQFLPSYDTVASAAAAAAVAAAAAAAAADEFLNHSHMHHSDYRSVF